jgi:hypothetical protein
VSLVEISGSLFALCDCKVYRVWFEKFAKILVAYRLYG